MTGQTLDTANESLITSAGAGARVYGLKLTPTAPAKPVKVEPYTCAVDGSGKPVLGPPLPAWANDMNWYPVNYVWRSTTLTRGNESVLFLEPPLDYWAEHSYEYWVRGGGYDMPPPARNDSLAVVWTGDKFKSVNRIPNVPPNAIVWHTPQGVVNINGTWMSDTQWQTALHLRESVRTIGSTSQPVTVDGFLNEWSPREFFATTLGTMALRVNAPTKLAVAITITNTAIAESLGSTGLDHRLDLSILPENEIFFVEAPSAFPKLDLEQGKTTEYYLVDTKGPQNSKSAHFAWTVQPDGKTCQIEVLVTGLPVNPAPAANPLSIGTRLLWYPSPVEKPLNLVADTPFGPLSYVFAHFK